MTDAQRIYDNLMNHPGDGPTMLVLADALEDEGRVSLAAAYRWAARNGKWPFRRVARHRWDAGSDIPGNVVYDWDREGRYSHLISQGETPVPEHALLPREVCNAIRSLPDRSYGGVHEAFALLSRALEAVAP